MSVLSKRKQARRREEAFYVSQVSREDYLTILRNGNIAVAWHWLVFQCGKKRLTWRLDARVHGCMMVDLDPDAGHLSWGRFSRRTPTWVGVSLRSMDDGRCKSILPYQSSTWGCRIDFISRLWDGVEFVTTLTRPCALFSF